MIPRRVSLRFIKVQRDLLRDGGALGKKLYQANWLIVCQ